MIVPICASVSGSPNATAPVRIVCTAPVIADTTIGRVTRATISAMTPLAMVMAQAADSSVSPRTPNATATASSACRPYRMAAGSRPKILKPESMCPSSRGIARHPAGRWGMPPLSGGSVIGFGGEPNGDTGNLLADARDQRVGVDRAVTRGESPGELGDGGGLRVEPGDDFPEPVVAVLAVRPGLPERRSRVDSLSNREDALLCGPHIGRDLVGEP